MDPQTWFSKKVKEFENDPEFVLDGILLAINEKICKILVKKGMNFKDFARRLDVSPAYVSKLLNGKPNLTIESLVKIALALDLKPEIDLKEIKSIIKISNEYSQDDFVDDDLKFKGDFSDDIFAYYAA